MDEELRQAFLDTTYGTLEVRLKLKAEPDPQLAWPPTLPGQRWAILTAWNPDGTQKAAEVNDGQQQRLTDRLHRDGWPTLPGHNGEGEWLEPTVIVPGLPLWRAVQLGRQFRQAAVLWGMGRRAALVWCRQNGEPLMPVELERLWLGRAAILPGDDRPHR
ncbi:DUF3293 domain-containing protein [Deinococcus sonorensis]|uniref:DUF3293 domain-containing protein n=2 Tax=Deinococcus sonorensis TaxID=309891 RepID=A0AAU7U8V8_9DEIO